MGLRKLLLFVVILLTIFWSCSDLGDPLHVPEIEVSTSLNFDSIALGDSTEATLQISNDGTLALILDSLHITGIDSADFQITSQIADSTQIAPKGDLDVVIQFKPSSQDDKTAALNIYSNDPKNPSLTVRFTVGDVVVTYSQIQPIVNTDKANCIMCHSGSGSNNLNLTSYANVMDGNSDHGPVIIPFDAGNSILVQKILGTASFGGRMPSSNPTYFDSNLVDLQLIKDWINQGALEKPGD